MKTKTLQPVLLFLIVITAFSFTANAQTGYIYVHKKTLDESSSVDFTFSGSGTIGAFTLNDNPTQIPVMDIGSSQNGRLWAVGTSNNTLYYRDIGSSAWTATAITNASRVDGGATNTCYVVLTTGSIISYNGASTTIGAKADYGASNAADVGSCWDTQPYIVTAAGKIYRYSGGGTTWAQVGATTNNISIDGIPGSTNFVVCKTDNIAYSVTSAGVPTSLGNAANTNGVTDVAADALGNIYACFASSVANTQPSVCKWNSGTSWTIENTSRGASNITAGAGGEVWAAGIDGNTAPFGNIFTRSFNGTAVQWIDDERVRTSPVNGNSEMIAVAPGTYTITETDPSGWDNTGITIGDPTNNSTADTINNTVTLNVAANETVNVIFINVKLNPFSMTTDCTVAYKEDFGTGTVGSFGPALTGQTSYHFIGVAGEAKDGYYKVVGTGTDWAFYSDAVSDHTSGNGQGRMMAVNASYEVSQFFRRRFTGLVPGATYNFSAWVAALTNSFAIIRPNVSFLVIDPNNYHTIASTTSGDITTVATWGQYTLSFVATTATVDLSIVNNTIGGYGNDLALDDISFTMVPPVFSTATTTTNVSCGSLGTITVTSPLGASYEYSKDGTNYQTSPSFTNAAIGNYTVYDRYVGTTGCISSTPATINVISTCSSPTAANIIASMSNNNGPTLLNPLTGAEPGVSITAYTIGNALPSAAQGVLYVCPGAVPGSCTAVTANQSLTPAQAAAIYFDPAPGYTGAITNISYTATDANGNISPAATISIVTTNEPPVANNIASQTISHTGISTLPALNANDADGSISNYKVTSLPNAGTQGTLTYCTTPPATGCGTAVVAGANLTPAQAASLSFTPVVTFTGTLNIPYTAADNNNQVSNTANLTIRIAATASAVIPPVAGNLLSPPMNNTNAHTKLPPLAATDLDGSITSYTITTIPSAASGILYLCTGAVPATCSAVTAGLTITPAQVGLLYFDPAPTFTGTASFNYTATDNTALVSAAAIVNIPVVNQPPVANNIIYGTIPKSTATNTSLPSLSANDPDGTIASFTVNTIPNAATEGILNTCPGAIPGTCVAVTAGQVLTPAQAAQLTFIPVTTFTGNTKFTFTATDNNGNTSTAATYGIMVGNPPLLAAGAPPVTNPVSTTMSNTNAATAIPALSGSDPNSDLSNYIVSSIPLAVQGVLTYCTAPPSTGCGTAVTVGISLTPVQAATLSFDPNGGYTGPVEFLYYAADAVSHNSNVSAYIINTTNNPPVSNNIINSKILNTSGPATLGSLQATDGDGTIGNYTITSIPAASQGTLNVCTTPPGTGCTAVTVGQVLTTAQAAQLAFTPTAGYNGIVYFGYTATDNNGLISNPAAVSIPVGSYTTLPVSLISFTATPEGNAVKLLWQAAAEINLSNYEVQYSTDGINYTAIGTVSANNSGYYYFIHNSPVAGINYYRLKLIDNNSNFTYSPVRIVNFGKEDILTIYPNPASNEINISVPVKWVSKSMAIQIIGLDGRMVVYQTIDAISQTETVDISNLPPGIYNVKLVFKNGESFNELLMIAR
jgi:hypothetical protein